VNYFFREKLINPGKGNGLDMKLGAIFLIKRGKHFYPRGGLGINKKGRDHKRGTKFNKALKGCCLTLKKGLLRDPL